MKEINRVEGVKPHVAGFKTRCDNCGRAIVLQWDSVNHEPEKECCNLLYKMEASNGNELHAVTYRRDDNE